MDPVQSRDPRHQWQAESYEETAPSHRVLSTWRVLVLALGLPLTACAGGAAWLLFWPDTVVQTRIIADSDGPGGRAALAEAALRLASERDGSAQLAARGDALLISATGGDADRVWQHVRSATDMLLNMVFLAGPGTTAARPTSGRTGLAPDDSRTGLVAERNRLQSAVDTIDSRIATTSASLTGIARDIAAGIRVSTDRKGGREVLDKGAAALADLQLQRIQLQSRYQDDYPAVIALDGQIRSMRSFLQDEGRRVDSASRTGADAADPILGGERDRLRTEISQLNERRLALGADLAAAIRNVAAARVGETGLPAEPVPTPRPAPVLIEAATTIASGPDQRWVAVPSAVGAGLLLSMLAWFKPRRRIPADRADLLLRRLDAALSASGVLPALPGGAYSAVAKDELPVLLRPRQARLNRHGQALPLA